MKKRALVVTLVVVVILVSALPAWADFGVPPAPPGNGPVTGRFQHRNVVNRWQTATGQQYFALVGIVTAVDAEAITVEVHNGNRFVKPFLGEELTIQLAETTVYQKWTENGCVTATFEDVAVDGAVSIRGTVEDEVFTASTVTVAVPLDCCTP